MYLKRLLFHRLIALTRELRNKKYDVVLNTYRHGGWLGTIQRHTRRIQHRFGALNRIGNQGRRFGKHWISIVGIRQYYRIAHGNAHLRHHAHVHERILRRHAGTDVLYCGPGEIILDVRISNKLTVYLTPVLLQLGELLSFLSKLHREIIQKALLSNQCFGIFPFRRPTATSAAM